MNWKSIKSQVDETRFLLKERSVQVVLWTILWVLPVMYGTICYTTQLQIHWAFKGYQWFSNLLAHYVPFIVGFWLQIPFIRIVLDREQDTRTSLGSSLREIFRFVPAMFVAGTVLFVGVFSGIVFFIIPGVWLLVNHTLFVQSAVGEQKSGITSLWRSGVLAKGFRLPILLLLILLALLELSVQAGMAVLLFVVSPESEYGLLSQTMVHAVLIPVQSIVLTFLYRNLVKVKESVKTRWEERLDYQLGRIAKHDEDIYLLKKSM